MTATMALAGDYYQGSARSRFMGLQAGFSSIGGILFLTAGGLLAETHWRAPFGIYGIALPLLPAIILFLPEPHGVIRRGSAGQGSDPADTGTAAWRVTAAVFFVAVVNSVAFYSIPTELPFYLQTLNIPEASRAGMAIGTGNVAAAAAAFAYTRVRARLDTAAVFAVAFALMAAGFELIALATGYVMVLCAMLVLGAGLGFVMPNMTGTVLQTAPAALRGRISGGLTASIFIGHFISPIFTRPVIAAIGFVGAYGLLGATVGTLALASAVLAVRQKFRAG